MIRRFSFLALTLLVTASSVAAAEDEGSVFMWKAQKDGAAVYLLGSVHALKQESYPLPEVIEAAFDSSAVVVFEIDLDEMTSKAVQMLEAGSLQDGQTLEQVVGPDMWSRFSTKMNAAGMPSGMFQFMEPWMAALTLTSFELEKAGYSAASGIDSHFWNRAGEAGKQRLALETVEFQIGLFAELTPEQSLEFLAFTIADLETIIPLMEELATSWREGNVAYVQDVTVSEFDEYPDLYERLNSARNRAWMPAIEELLAGPRDAMVIVGAMHLVGEDGIVEMLRQRGYTVTQL
jgi:uncharacterized protein YbaP (TraB family)